MKALIGYSGFVGSTLMKQVQFDELYRSTNIGDIEGRSFDLVVCAGAPAQKWVANANPEEDERNINHLIGHLERIKTRLFILISTVDVFKVPINVTEETVVDEAGLSPYGLNRRKLEKFVRHHFEKHLVVRLPGLVGPGLRKNVVFDMKFNNNIEKIESRGIYQFYPMVNLWKDVERSLELGVNLVHLTAEPIIVSEVAKDVFGLSFKNEIGVPARYDFKTIYGPQFSGSHGYQYSKKETLLALRCYAQS
jgi:nucleoside-diphosphate-sugar epimerase